MFELDHQLQFKANQKPSLVSTEQAQTWVMIALNHEKEQKHYAGNASAHQKLHV